MTGWKRAAKLLVLTAALCASVASTAAAAELSAPTVASWSTTRFDVFARGEDGMIYQRYYDNGTWYGWGSLGAPSVGAASSPTVTSPGPNVLQVFVRGGDGYIWNNHWTHGQGQGPYGWSGWGRVPNTGNATWAPSATNGGDHTPDVFYTGTDGALWYTRYDDVNGWNWPVSLGGGVSGSPGATTTAGGRMQVAVRGTDNNIYLRFTQSSYADWTAWAPIPGAQTSMSPAVTTGNDGQFNMFFRGVNDAVMYHEYYSATSGWVGPGAIPGSNLVSSPAAARLNIYQRTSSGDITQFYYDPSWGWRGPGSIGQPSSNGRLFREQNSNAVFLMNGGTRHWVPSPAVAQAYGLDLGSTQIVPDGSLNSVPRGADLGTLDSITLGAAVVEEGPDEPASAADREGDPAGREASAAAGSRCKTFTNRFPYYVGPQEAGWTTLRTRYCRNPVARTAWAFSSQVSMTDHTSTGFQVLGYGIERDSDKTIYPVTYVSGYPRSGVHMEMTWKVKHCVPPLSPLAICTRSKAFHSVSYGYYNGRKTTRNYRE